MGGNGSIVDGDVDYSNFSFSEGWIEEEIETEDEVVTNVYFDPMELRPSERRDWAEALGITLDLAVKNSYRTHPWNEMQLNTYQTRLEGGLDFKQKEGRRGRIDLYIYNPAINYFLKNPMPDITRETREWILRGLVSNLLSRNPRYNEDAKRKNDDPRKLLHVTGIKQVARTALEQMHVNGIDALPEEYKKTGRWNRPRHIFSNWILNPEQVKDLIIPEYDTEGIRHLLDSLTDFTQPELAPLVLQRKLELKRYTSGERMIEEGRMGDRDVEDLKREHKRLIRDINELEAELIELGKGQSTLSNFDTNDNGSIDGESLDLLRDKRLEDLKRLRSRLSRGIESRESEGSKSNGPDHYERDQWKKQKARMH